MFSNHTTDTDPDDAVEVVDQTPARDAGITTVEVLLLAAVMIGVIVALASGLDGVVSDVIARLTDAVS